MGSPISFEKKIAKVLGNAPSFVFENEIIVGTSSSDQSVKVTGLGSNFENYRGFYMT